MFFASLAYDALAGLGCATLTVMVFMAVIVLVGLRLNWFPELGRLLKRLANTKPAEAEKGGNEKS